MVEVRVFTLGLAGRGDGYLQCGLDCRGVLVNNYDHKYKLAADQDGLSIFAIKPILSTKSRYVTNSVWIQVILKQLRLQHDAQEINSFGWYNDTVKIHQSQPNIYTLFRRFDLITRSSSENEDLVMRSKRQNKV